MGNSSGPTEMKSFNSPNFSQLDTMLEDEKLVLGYHVNTCNRCLTTDCSVINFQYDGVEGKVGPTELPRKESFSFQMNHLCDEKYLMNEIYGLEPHDIGEFEKCVEMEKNSGQFLLKAISSGSWIEKTKSLVALKIPPTPPDDERIHALINCQVLLPVASTGNTNVVGYQQLSSSPATIAAQINLQGIPVIQAPNSRWPIFQAAIKDGMVRLDETEVIKYCEYARESSFVTVSVDISASGRDMMDGIISSYCAKTREILYIFPVASDFHGVCKRMHH